VRSIAVDLDARVGVRLAVGVATDVVATFEDQDLKAQLGSDPLGHGEPEESGSYDDEGRLH
jgi:hypothetical protein